jgi:hypothetical protein
MLLLLSLYLLGMSCIPCSDTTECNVSPQVEVLASNNHQEHNHTQEACTPFCTCSCCAALFFYNPLNKVEAAKIFFQSEKYPLQNEVFDIEVSNFIWQPPKIAA